MPGRSPCLPLVIALALAALALHGCRSTRGPRSTELERIPAHKRYVLSFLGNIAFPEGELRDVIADDLRELERRKLSQAAVDDAAWALEHHHRVEGFPFATVDYTYDLGPTEILKVTFVIVEGPRTRVRRIDLVGVESFDPRELHALYKAGGRGVLGSQDPLYVEQAAEAFADAVTGFYRSRGYLDVAVEGPAVRLSRDRGDAAIRLEVDEGPRYELLRLELSGDLIYPEKELRQELQAFIGRPYHPRTAYEVAARLQEVYRKRGHPDVETPFEERKIGRARGAMVIALRVDPGPRVRVSGVRIHGNEQTSAAFIRDRLSIEPGDIYDIEAERETLRRLYRTGLFRLVRLEYRGEREGAEERVLEVHVAELPSLELGVEVGYGSWELARLRLGIQERNLFGAGRVARVDTLAAVRAQRIDGRLTDPYLLGEDVTLSVTGFASRREEPSFTLFEFGGGGGIGREWTNNLRTDLDYTFRRSRLTNVEVEEDEEEAKQAVNIASIAFGPTYDTRDNLLLPSEGSLTRATAEVADHAVGSQVDFFRARLQHAHFFPLTDSTVLGLALEGGVIVPTRRTETIPLQERYFNGGESSVRAFKEDELGPKDDKGKPLGGEAYGVASIELRQRLYGNLYGAGFVDAGNVLAAHEEAPEVGEGSEFGYGVGAGLRYFLPVGPIRLDAAWNPEPEEDEDDLNVHFSVGLAF